MSNNSSPASQANIGSLDLHLLLHTHTETDISQVQGTGSLKQAQSNKTEKHQNVIIDK